MRFTLVEWAEMKSQCCSLFLTLLCSFGVNSRGDLSLYLQQKTDWVNSQFNHTSFSFINFEVKCLVIVLLYGRGAVQSGFHLGLISKSRTFLFNFKTLKTQKGVLRKQTIGGTLQTT